MIPLGEFLTSLLTSVTQGHAIADNKAGEIAKLYKDHELLKHFPVPKFSISYIDFEVNMSITEYKEIPKIPDDAEKQFRKNVADYIQRNIPTLPETMALIKKMGLSEDILGKENNIRFIRASSLSLIKNIPSVQILDEETKETCEDYFADNMVESLVDLLIRQRMIVKKKIIIKEAETERNALKEKVKQIFANFTSSWWKAFLQKNPLLPKDKIPIIAVEPKELISISPEKLIKAKIHLEVRPYEWTSMEVEDEKKRKIIKYKLVPE